MRQLFQKRYKSIIKKPTASGIYHIGDEGNDTLQSFLDFACDIWQCHRPWRMPLWLIYLAAEIFEFVSRIFKTKSPLWKLKLRASEIGRAPAA